MYSCAKWAKNVTLITVKECIGLDVEEDNRIVGCRQRCSRIVADFIAKRLHCNLGTEIRCLLRKGQRDVAFCPTSLLSHLLSHGKYPALCGCNLMVLYNLNSQLWDIDIAIVKEELMQEIIIDKEFQALLPPLDEGTYTALEASILEYGCRDPLVLWGNILIDGHNRYSVVTKHKLSYKTVNIEFSSREEAMIWIISAQYARRNLTPMQIMLLRGRHYLLALKIKTNEKGINQYSEVVGQNVLQPTHNATAAALGKKYKVDQRTIRRDGKSVKGIDRVAGISPEAGRMIASEEVKVDKHVLQNICNLPEDKVAQFAETIVQGTYEKPKPENKTAKPGPGPGSGPTGVTGTTGTTDATEAEAHPLQLTIFMLMDDLSNELQEVKTDDTAAQKTAFRNYIDKLEKLYKDLYES